jgi:MscS family membrane protein
MFRLSFLALISAGLLAQTPAAPVKDPLGRETPQQAITRFLEACHSRDYTKASRYLDLRRLPAATSAKTGLELAQQLEDLLDDTPFDIASLSREPEGDQDDELPEGFQQLEKINVEGKVVDLQLQRVELRPGLNVWLVSAGSISLIPLAHQIVAETPFEKKLPQQLVTFELFDTPVWRWIALLLLAVAVWLLATLVSWVVTLGIKRIPGAEALAGPLRLCLWSAAFRLAVELAPPATLAHLYVERGLAFTFFIGLAWLLAVMVDLVADRWQARLDPRIQAVSFSVLPLGRQVLKLSLFLIAILTVISAWGYNTSTILAGLGVGGLAVALAAQKTIENLFGGVSVIGDRPVLVGDTCRFGDRTGTIMHIGLRSTRIRTPERTIISVPNAQFSSMALENISGRDKIWFHPTLNLRRDTTSAQLTDVLASISQVLAGHENVETGKIPVRFVGVGSYSLDIDVSAYIKTSDYDEFLANQQELLLQILQAVEKAGTALAVPLQESVDTHRA